MLRRITSRAFRNIVESNVALTGCFPQNIYKLSVSLSVSQSIIHSLFSNFAHTPQLLLNYGSTKLNKACCKQLCSNRRPDVWNQRGANWTQELLTCKRNAKMIIEKESQFKIPVSQIFRKRASRVSSSWYWQERWFPRTSGFFENYG